MGEVYRARDARLSREVAIKVLPAAFAHDSDRLRRFQQEAQAVAALNHPNILAIYDFGEHEGSPYIVTEYLDGETLRGRLNTGSLPLRKVTEMAEQITRGLAGAHDKGIVHRDLKPENIFVMRDGRVKILDFGLAKLTPETLHPDAATMASRTEPGVVMGTVGYMSPEQVKGMAADHRSDLFSFGAILYEMVSGKRAFRGETSVETMSAILKEDPPELTETARNVPPALDRIIRHCLEKNPEERFQSARDVAFNLTNLSEISGSTATLWSGKPTDTKRTRWSVVAGSLLLMIGLGTGLVWPRKSQPATPVFHRVTYRTGSVVNAAFTPDGHTIVYEASWEGTPAKLFATRAEFPQPQDLGFAKASLLGVSSTNELALLMGGGMPGESTGTLARAPISGGAPREVLKNVRDATWSPDGQLAIVHTVNGRDRLEYPIGSVLYETSGWINFPRFSAQGNQIAFLDHTSMPDTRGVVSVVNLHGHKRALTKEWEDLRGLAWSARGDEVWFAAAENGAIDLLYAVSLAGKQRVVLSIPSKVALKDIHSDGRVLLTSSDSRTGIMAHAAGANREKDISWYDATYLADISPDGHSVLFDEEGAMGGPHYSVGIRGLDGSPVVRLGEGYSGRFSPDGRWVTSFNTNPAKITLLPLAAGEARDVPLPGIERIVGLNVGFFPGGQRIWFGGAQPGHPARTYVQSIDGGTPSPITPEGILARDVSPDGKFLVGSDLEGRIVMFPADGGTPQIVPGDNASLVFVQWRADGHSIYVRDDGLPATVYEVSLSSGQKHPVLKLMPADPAGMVSIGYIVMSRDAKSYAYNYNRDLSQLLVVEGLN